MSRGGEGVPVSARNFDLLLFFVENGGRILEHDELLDKVWAGTFVEQATLQKGVSALRQILAEAPEFEFIKTIPRRGYSFVSPVRAVPDEGELVYVRETEREITIEEYEETEDERARPATRFQELPAAAPAPSRLAKLKHYQIPLAGTSIILLGLLGFGIWTLASKARPVFSVENIKIEKLTTRGDLNGVVISPDGKYIAYAALENDGTSMWVQQIATGRSSRLTPKMQASFWFYTFSPDSNFIYYTVNRNSVLAQNGTFRISLLGGSPQRINEEAIPFMFSPDGTRIAFVRPVDGQLQAIASGTDFSDEKLVTTFSDQFRLWSMNWSPDGKNLLFAVRKFTAHSTVHYIVEFPVSGGPGNIVMPEMDRQISSAIWLPDMKSVLVSLREVNAEIRQLWQYFPVTNEFRHVTNDSNSYKALSLSRDGRSAVSITENFYGAIWVAEDAEYNFKQTASGTSKFAAVCWTADGRMIYSATENSVESLSIMNADGTQSRQITTGHDGVRLYPRVSADGRSVLFVSTRSGSRQLWRTDLDGRSFVQMTHVENIQIFDGKLLSDNQTVVFCGEEPGRSAILYKQTSDGTVTPLGRENVDAWDVSPDEKYLAYSTTDEHSQKTHVAVKSLVDDSLVKAFDIQPFSHLRWTRDGLSLTFDAADEESKEIFLQSVAGGAPKLLAKFPAEQIPSFDWSFDGKKIAIVRGKQLNDAMLINLVATPN
ncbi:MAG: winged helix-turn-helix domain-containing protein [Pyrinomonadaceae bacterium]